MSSRKRLLLLMSLLVALIVVAWWPARPGITVANACRFSVGMTMAQVEGIMGSAAIGECAAEHDPRESSDHIWWSESAWVQVGFHGPGRTLRYASAHGMGKDAGRFCVLPRKPYLEQVREILHHLLPRQFPNYRVRE